MKTSVLSRIPVAPKLDKATRVSRMNGKASKPEPVAETEPLPEFITAKNRKGKTYSVESRFITASGSLVQFKASKAMTDYVTLRRKEKLTLIQLKSDYAKLRDTFNTLSCIVAHTLGTDGLRRLAVRSLSKNPDQVAYTMSGRADNTGTLTDWASVQSARKAERDAVKAIKA